MDLNRSNTQPQFRTGPQSLEYAWPPQRSLSTTSHPIFEARRSASLQNDPDIYEPIYDSRWRLLNQEAAKFQRDGQLSKSPTPASSSSISSRESSVGPPGSVVCSSPSLAILSDKSSKTLRIPRRGKDFGFTLRHFIVYPPEEDEDGESPSIKQPMETIFVKSIKQAGPAHLAGLQTGDRILSVNGCSVEKLSYADVVKLIQLTRDCLDLVVVSKQDDVLQTYFGEIAQNPETNQRKSSNQSWLSSKEPVYESNFPCYEPVRLQPQVIPELQRKTSSAFESSRLFRTDTTLPDHAYAVPARVIEMAESLTSLESGSTSLTVSKTGLSGCETGFSSFPVTPSDEDLFHDHQPTSLVHFGQQVCCAPASVVQRPVQVFQRPLPPVPGRPSVTRQTISTSAKRKPEIYRSDPIPRYHTAPEHITNARHLGPEHHRTSSVIDEPVIGHRSTLSPPERSFRIPEMSEATYSEPVWSDNSGPVSRPRQRPSVLSLSSSNTGFVSTEFIDHPGNIFRRNVQQVADGPRHKFDKVRSARPFQSRDLENVRQITSAIIERTPDLEMDLDESEQLYSTVQQWANPLPSDVSVPESESAVEAVTVIRRTKMKLASQAEINHRRKSYLMATTETASESDDDVIKVETVQSRSVSCTDGSKSLNQGVGVQKIFSVFGKKSDATMSTTTSPKLGERKQTETPSPTIKEGWLQVLVSSKDGKKSDARNWKNIYTVIKTDVIYFHKDKAAAGNETAIFLLDDIPLSIKKFDLSDVASFGTEEFLFKIKTESGTELLLKAESISSMQEWVQVIQELVAPADSKKSRIRKTRSPASQSPVTKARKATIEQIPEESSEGKKTWKGKVAKQWKKIQQQGPNPQGPLSTYPEGGSIGVPIEECPRSKAPGCENVPLLVQVCCSIVEERGLDIVGIYRVPGNSANVNFLTEQVNRGEESFQLDDTRWCDVHVVSSLLKSFFRKLPDPLFTLDLYSTFIDVSKVEDSLMRLKSLKSQIRRLPDVNFATLRFVCRHLKNVISNCDANKMEVKNLSIVFGPTLVRTSDDNMMSMITDMGQQCRIIESILSNCDWFFSQDERDLQTSGEGPTEINQLMAETEITQTGNQSILLTNLQKLEGSGKVGSPVRDISAKDIVSGIISAANQKMLRAGKSGKKDSVDSANRRFSEAVSVAVDTAARIVDSSTMTTSLYEKPGWSEQQIVVKTESAPVLVRPDQPVPTALNQVVDAPRVHDENVTHKSASFENSRCSNRPDQDDIPVAKEVELEMKCEDDATPVFKVHVEPVKSCQQSVSGMRPIVKSESVPQQMSNLSSTCYTPVYENISRSREYLTTGKASRSQSRERLNAVDLKRFYNDDGSAFEKLSRENNLDLSLESSSRRDSTHSRFVNHNYCSNPSVNRYGFSLSPDSSSKRLILDEEKENEAKLNNRDQEKIVSLTASFDEKLRLLLDPHYQTAATMNGAARSEEYFFENCRLADLKRSRAKEPLSRQKSNSLTKQQKQEINARRKSSSTPMTTSKQLKASEQQRCRIRRRHTVGGTKDIGKENLIVTIKECKNFQTNLSRRLSLPEPT